MKAAGPLNASAFEIKCSRRNSPIGTMPVRECKRRNQNDLPTPARSGATPGLIFEGMDWVDEANVTVPCLVWSVKPTFHYVGWRSRESR